MFLLLHILACCYNVTMLFTVENEYANGMCLMSDHCNFLTFFNNSYYIC